ncbi:integrase/recombinase XerD [Cetobacterium ceti]|uniref:Integrase/recombinase XerD n=1 Tax=Cetobacterium ceti TaxID=180163 RepID=A0A1T4L1V2_9FUSO|nr:tyrosine-type recombinase/integrase [Cetobacterium ceti]SJZ48712.1 integrase/recombinase XerD [Cetobacterium ceti]
MNLLKEFLEWSRKEGNISLSTMEMYKSDIRDFRKFIGKIPFEDITEKEIVRYIEFLKGKYQERSINRKFTSLKQFYKYLLRKKIIDIYPLENIVIGKVDNKPGEMLEWGEIKAIYEACEKSPKGKRDQLIIKILCETGVLIVDILGMKLSDVREKEFKYFTILKNGKLTLVQLEERTSKELKDYVEIDRKSLIGDMDSDYIFYGLSRQNFRSRFIKAGEKAGIEREISPNMVRNTITQDKERSKDKSGEGLTLLEKIKKQYISIGIGDD